MSNLGDAWYSEETPALDTLSQTSPDYWREKAREFQVALNAADKIAVEGYAALGSRLPPGAERDAIAQAVAEYEEKKSWLKGIAEAVNAFAALYNGVGGRFPKLSIPQSLGFLPFAVPAAVAGSLALLGSAIAWCVAWSRNTATQIGAAPQAASMITDEQLRNETLAEVSRIAARANAAALEAEGSPFAGLGSALKWGGIAVLAFLAYQAWQKSRG
jgi:hypothetical protein